MKLQLHKNSVTLTAITCSKLTFKTLEQRCEICSKLNYKETRTASECWPGVFNVNFEHNSHLVPVLL